MSESTSTDEPASSAGFPSWSDLTDASRYSIYAILVSLFLIVTLWRGIKICGCLEKRSIVTETKIDEEGKEKQMKYEEIEYTYVHILWPFKVLTVLFHEMSHAMVGMATLGRVAYISVDAQEGGETQFRPPPARQPAYKPTLAAGYLGSCLIGCALLGAGFDALASKYAALALIFYLLVLLFICASIRTKSTLTHNRDRIAYWFNRILGYKSAMETRLKRLKKKEKEVKDNQDKMGSMRDRMEQLLGRMQRGELRSRDKRKDEKELEKLEMEFAEVAEVVYREKMVSLDTICLVAFLILLFILPSWLIADSAGLRFVILFIGLFSAVYAVQDIYDDCIRNRHVHGSDANAYARITLGPLDLGEEEVRTRQGREKLEGYEKDVRRRTKFLAWLSLTLQLFALLVTILLTLYFVRTTTAEQALESRSFLPSPWHLNSADLLEQAQKGKEGLKSGVDWGKGKIGEVWDGDEA